MTVPGRLVGAWRRSGLFVEDVRRVDYCEVLWVQTPEWYADLRLLVDRDANPVPPADPAVPAWLYQEMCFAGRGHWKAPRMTWTHVLDLDPDPAEDANPLSWEDGVVVERGATERDGRPVSYREDWLRMTPAGADWSVETGDRRVRVAVGRFAIEVEDRRPKGAFRATRLHLGAEGWQEVASLTV